MEAVDERALQAVKAELGGSIKPKGRNALRYRITTTRGMKGILSRLNGEIRNTVRVEQLKKLCLYFDVPYKEPSRLTRNHSWFIGFMDADGSITGNLEKPDPQIAIKATNKASVNVEMLEIFGGRVRFDRAQQGCYNWSISSREDILNFMEYAKAHPFRTEKRQRLHMIPRYYELKAQRAHKAEEGTVLNKAWLEMKRKWRK